MNNEPIARILDIKYVGRKDQFVSKPNEGRIIPATHINYHGLHKGLTIIRPTGVTTEVKCLSGWVNMMLYWGDIIQTGDDVLMSIEFLIGGRVSINRSSLALLNSNRSISPVFDETLANLPRLIYESAAFFIPLMPSAAKDDMRKMSEPLWIKSNALGIRG